MKTKTAMAWMSVGAGVFLAGGLTLAGCSWAEALLTDEAALRTWCNPMDLPYRYRPDLKPGARAFREGADPTLIVWKGAYWLFASKMGGYFRSPDMLAWEKIVPEGLPLERYAPTAFGDANALFVGAAGTQNFRSEDPASGKWTPVGDGHSGMGADPQHFRDDDGRVYVMGGGGPSTVDKPLKLSIGERDRATLRDVPRRGAVTYASDIARYGWELRGDNNEHATGYQEGSAMNRRGDTYYFQYAGPGTEYSSYCDAVMVGKDPLGPFVRQALNPFSWKAGGFARGAGHGSTFVDLHGNWWHVATALIGGVERRIVRYPVFFDADGEMWADTAYGDFPMRTPEGKVESSAELHTDWMILTALKKVTVSSELPRFPAKQAVDENMRTFFCAKTSNAGEFLAVDLDGEATIRAVQVNFADWKSEQRGTPAADPAYRYRLEVSDDGATWRTLVDRSENKVEAPNEYIPLPRPVRARHLRLVNLRIPSGLFALHGLRAFGSMEKPKPAAVTGVTVVRPATDLRKSTVSWRPVEGATGYVVRFGPSRAKMHLSKMVFGAIGTPVNVLDAQRDYFYTVEAFNEAGIGPASDVVSVPAR